MKNDITTDVAIFGSGIAGGMAAGALSSRLPTVLEMRSHNKKSDHQAIMRLRDPNVARYLGCGAKEITVRKEVYFRGQYYSTDNILFNNLYSMKTYGVLGRRSLRKLGDVKRFLIEGNIIPPNTKHHRKLIRVTKDRRAIFDVKSGSESWQETFKYNVAISTLPLPKLLLITGLEKSYKELIQSCKCMPIHVDRCEIDLHSEVHQSLYFPDLKTPVYRASLEGKTLIIESVGQLTDMQIHSTASAFGLKPDLIMEVNSYKQPNGKLLPVDDVLRRKALMDLTERFNIYSFGRFAIWKPIRADHLISDIEKISTMISVGELDRKYMLRKGGEKI